MHLSGFARPAFGGVDLVPSESAMRASLRRSFSLVLSSPRSWQRHCQERVHQCRVDPISSARGEFPSSDPTSSSFSSPSPSASSSPDTSLHTPPSASTTPLDPSRPWLVHPRRTKLPPPSNKNHHDSPADVASDSATSPVSDSSMGQNLTLEQGEEEVGGEGATGRGWFPHSGVFRVGDRELSSSQVLELLTPFMAEGRVQRMRSVVENRTVGLVVVVEGLSDLGNVSAVCRTCDGLGYQNVHVVSSSSGRSRLFRNNRRVSMGSDKWLDVETWGSSGLCLPELKRRGYRVAVTSLATSSVDMYSVDWSIPTAVVFGNEHMGASEEAIQSADLLVTIPMLGMVESFNISVATALLLHHAMRDRIARTGRHGDLSEAQRETLMAHFALRHRGSQSMSVIEHLVHEQVVKAKDGEGVSPGAVKGAQRRMREILNIQSARSQVGSVRGD